MSMVYTPHTWNNEVITDAKLNAIEQGVRAGTLLSGTDIDADKDWGGKNITSLGKISPKTWLILTGADPLLISKSHASSTTVTFAQLDGTGHVKVVAGGGEEHHSYGTRNFTILKNGSPIWTKSQGSRWNGETDIFDAFTETAIEDLSITSGDTLTISQTGSSGVTIMVYSTPLVAPYGIVS